MSKFVLTDAVITVNAVALSNSANSVTLNYEVDAIETTGFGDTGHRFQGGLQNVSAEVTFFQSMAAANVEATIYPLVGTTTTVTFKATSAATSATNPLFTLANTFVASHTPISGSVGEPAQTTVSFQGGTLTKATV